MKAQQLYTLSIAYFLVFVVAVFASGLTLFFVELGVGDLDTFSTVISQMKPKSIEGIIEILTPHIMGMGLMLFVVAHFLLFSKKFSHTFSFRVFLALVFVVLIDQSAYLFISSGFEIFGWVKVFSLLVYAFLLSLLVWMVAISL